MSLNQAEILSDFSSDQKEAYVNDHYDDYMYDESFEDIFKVTIASATV